MRLDWKAILGIAITVLLVWWAFSRVDAGDVWNQILSGDLLLLSAAVAVATFGFFIRAMRWKILLHAVKPDTKLGSRFAAVIPPGVFPAARQVIQYCSITKGATIPRPKPCPCVPDRW